MKKVYLGNLGGRIPGFNINLEVKKGVTHLSDSEITEVVTFLNNQGHPNVSINKSTNVATVTFTPFSEDLISKVKKSLNMDLRIAFLKRAHSYTRRWKNRFYYSDINLPIPSSPLTDSTTTRLTTFTLADINVIKLNSQLQLTEQMLRAGQFQIDLNTIRTLYTNKVLLNIPNICTHTQEELPAGVPWKIYLHLGLSVIKKGEAIQKLFTYFDYVI